MGYCTLIVGNLVAWRSAKQKVVAQSSIEAESQSKVDGISRGLWVKGVLEDLKISQEGSMRMCFDNQSAIEIARNPVQHKRTKHVDVFFSGKGQGTVMQKLVTEPHC